MLNSATLRNETTMELATVCKDAADLALMATGFQKTTQAARNGVLVVSNLTFLCATRCQKAAEDLNKELSLDSKNGKTEEERVQSLFFRKTFGLK